MSPVQLDLFERVYAIVYEDDEVLTFCYYDENGDYICEHVWKDLISDPE